MRMLLLAPHPYYQERGTPIAVDCMLRVLSAEGHIIDVVTYNEGDERSYSGVRIFRIKPTFTIANVRPGFSFKKIYCDAYLFFKSLGMLMRTRYDVIHAVEESVFMAYVFNKIFRIPYVYDMDSLLSRQIVDKFRAFRFLEKSLRFIESRAIRSSINVLTMCDNLRDEAAELGARAVTVIRDMTMLDNMGTGESVASLRDTCTINGLIVMYIGNLEKYQGIDLLLNGFKDADPANHNACLVIIGGRQDDIARYTAMTRSMAIENYVCFLGPRPLNDLQLYLDQADILVSPRIQGNNTPMKIYSYLDSGKPLLATRIASHTDVLDDEIAELVATDAKSFAEGLIKLYESRPLREMKAERAKVRVKEHYSFDAFKEKMILFHKKIEKKVKKPSVNNSSNKDIVTKEFNDKAAVYESYFYAGLYKAHAEIIMSCMNPVLDGAVLDIGCGTGWLLRQIARLHSEVKIIGVDFSDRMMYEARAKASTDNIKNAEFLCCDWERLQRERLINKNIKAVVCASAFHYFDDPLSALKKMYDVLDAGGELVLFERDKSGSLLTPVWGLAHKYFIKDNILYYHAKELVALLQQAGFSDVIVKRRIKKFFWHGKMYSSLVLITGKK